MSLKLTKQNLVYILLVLKLEKHNGNFITDIIREVVKSINAHNRNRNKQYKSISKATLYNYFADLKRLSIGDYAADEAFELSRKINDSHPALINKFYKKFNVVMFEVIVKFLIENRYLKIDDFSRLVQSVDNNLFFSISSFLQVPKSSLDRDALKLEGEYRVYRPSLSSSGKIIVSCARIFCSDNGALKYEEIMHFKSVRGWKKQSVDGYIFSKLATFFLITKDTNTRLAQFSILEAREVIEDKEGKPVVQVLCGSYNGTSNHVPSKLYTTGVLMVREKFGERSDFEMFYKSEFKNWDIGHVEKFGLVDKKNVSEKYLQYLFEYYPVNTSHRNLNM